MCFVVSVLKASDIAQWHERLSGEYKVLISMPGTKNKTKTNFSIYLELLNFDLIFNSPHCISLISLSFPLGFLPLLLCLYTSALIYNNKHYFKIVRCIVLTFPEPCHKINTSYYKTMLCKPYYMKIFAQYF